MLTVFVHYHHRLLTNNVTFTITCYTILRDSRFNIIGGYQGKAEAYITDHPTYNFLRTLDNVYTDKQISKKINRKLKKKLKKKAMYRL